VLLDPSTEVRADDPSLSGIEATLLFGRGAAIDKGCILWLGIQDGKSGTIAIGENTYIGPYTFIGSCHSLSIGENSMIGANCYLITVNHQTTDKDLPYGEQGYAGNNITLGKNVWLGSHVVVLPGVTIGDGAVVGAGAVVTRDIPPGETWAGVPARKLKDRQ
jgi:acetyltransferase-like isoleucine patch superfamily enzyme